MLAEIYFDGKGVEKNCTEAKKYYELAHKQNYSEGTYMLGYLYYFGFGTELNYLLAK